MILEKEAETMLDIAHIWAKRATCSRLSVGAVISRDGRIISSGYNGVPSNFRHCQHVDDSPCKLSVHAEANSLVFAAKYGVRVEGATMYCTHSPCVACAGLIINSGIASVVYEFDYRSRDGVELLLASTKLSTYQYEREVK